MNPRYTSEGTTRVHCLLRLIHLRGHSFSSTNSNTETMSSNVCCRLLFVFCLFSNYSFAIGKLERVSLRGGGGEDADITTEEDEVARLKQDHLLLANSNLPRQRVTAYGDFEANGRTYSVNDLQSFNVYTTNATIMVDGKPQPLEDDDSSRSRLFMSTGERTERQS